MEYQPLQLASGAAVEARPERAPEDHDENLPLALRHRVISLRDMPRSLHRLTICALLLLVGAALALWAGTQPQPYVSVGMTRNALPIAVPLIVLIYTSLMLVPAVAFALAGALRMPWGLRFTVVGLLVTVLGAAPVFALRAIGSSSDQLLATDRTLRWAQVGVLAVFVLWAIGESIARSQRVARQGRPTAENALWPRLAFPLVCGLVLVYYGLDVLVWRAFAVAGHADQGLTVLVGDLSIQAGILPVLLGGVVYWASTDMAEWGEALAVSLVAFARRTHLPGLVFTLTVLAAIGVAYDVLRVDSRFILPSLVLATMLAGVLILVTRFARINPTWPAHPPLSALVGGAIFLFSTSIFFVSADVGPLFGILTDLGFGQSYSIGDMVSAGVDVLGITIGLYLIARGRAKGRGRIGAIGLFLTMVALVTLLSSLPDLARTAGFRGVYPPYLTLDAIRLCAALWTLFLALWLAVRRRATGDPAGPLARAFILLAGLQAISWLLQASATLRAQDALPAAATAGLFLAAVFWDVIMSGGQVTNQGRLFSPREARVLLYLGYSMIASITLVYIGSERLLGSGAPVPLQFSLDDVSHQGLINLGVPLVTLSFMLSCGRWVAAGRQHAAAARLTSDRSGLLAQFAIFGGGAFALALVAVVTATNVLPNLSASTLSPLAKLPYIAHIPGSGCDPYGGVWQPDRDAETSCSSAGMRVVVPARTNGHVEFVTPEGFGLLPEKYNVSVHVVFNSPGTVCAGILMRFAKEGANAHYVCSTGSYGIVHFDFVSAKQSVPIKAKGLPASAYTLDATVDGVQQRTAPVGSTPVTAADTSHAGAERTGLIVFNLTDAAVAATFSDFIFTPLA